MQTQRQRAAANPFAMLLDPQAVLAQLAGSERLERLERRICRPLDKPLIGQVSADDAAIDADSPEAELADAGETSTLHSSCTELLQALAPSTSQ